MKTFKQFDEGKLDDKMDKYVSDEIKKRKLAKSVFAERLGWIF